MLSLLLLKESILAVGECEYVKALSNIAHRSARVIPLCVNITSYGTTHCCGLFSLPARRLAPAAGVTVLGGPKKPNPCFTRGADKHDNINFSDLKIHPR